MLKNKNWTEREMDKLRFLYISRRTFDEIIDSFPNRTANAVRIKASRMGIKRPITPSYLIKSQKILRCLNDGVEEYLFKCNNCNNWIHVELNEEDKKIVCHKCNSNYRYVT
jgi:DNA-directed RNA polymerase subunit RPC12/RpoP